MTGDEWEVMGNAELEVMACLNEWSELLCRVWKLEREISVRNVARWLDVPLAFLKECLAMALVRNEQAQPMGEIYRNEKGGFTALTVHERGNGIDTLLEFNRALLTMAGGRKGPFRNDPPPWGVKNKMASPEKRSCIFRRGGLS